MTDKQMQWQLYILGYYPRNEIGTGWGLLSVKALNEFRTDNHLPSNGLRHCGIDRDVSRKLVTELQRKAGMPENQIDGLAGPKTEAAITSHKKPKPVEKPVEKTETDDFWSTVKYFDRSEFACPCGRCGGFPVEPDHDMVRLCDKIREHFGPFRPTSGVRCKAHNAELKNSSPRSQHLYGKAADISIPGVGAKALYDYAQGLLGNTGGLGIYSWGIHIDTRDGYSRWDYR